MIGFEINGGAIVQAVLVAVLGFGARQFWKVSVMVERQEVVQKDHARRLNLLEQKVA